MEYAPIAVFAFNRPKHLEQTLYSLSKNYGAENSELYIFIDGPKTETDIKMISECNSIALSYEKQFRKLYIETNSVNLGLANSIIGGISKLLKLNNNLIIIEDDLVTSEYFLDFMNRGLAKYENNLNVASIHGFVLPFKRRLTSPFFLRGADCWGWATWSNRWELFISNGTRLLDELEAQKLTYEFDLNGAYPFTQMLRDQILGKNNSWAIRWHASMFLLNKLTLYPSETYVNNIGFDGSGTHTGNTNVYYSALSRIQQQLPEVVEENLKAKNEIQNWYLNVYFGKKAKFNRRLLSFYLGFSKRLKRMLNIKL